MKKIVKFVIIKGEKIVENKNKTLKQARQTMNYLTGDEEVRRLAELREKWAMERYFDLKNAKHEGKKEGSKEGIQKTKIQIAQEI